MNEKDGKAEGAREALSPDEQKVNKLLANPLVKKELQETRSIASMVRRGHQGKLARLVSEGTIKSYKPQFLHIAEFQTALYDCRDMSLYLHAWDVSHDSMIAEKGSILKHRSRHQLPETVTRYIVGDVFVLREAEDVKIMIADTPFSLRSEDIAAIEKSGYLVIDSNLNWLSVGKGEPRHGASKVTPSSISRGWDCR